MNIKHFINNVLTESKLTSILLQLLFRQHHSSQLVLRVRQLQYNIVFSFLVLPLCNNLWKDKISSPLPLIKTYCYIISIWSIVNLISNTYINAAIISWTSASSPNIVTFTNIHIGFLQFRITLLRTRQYVDHNSK